MPNTFISCDWGTTSLRLYLVNIDSHQILHQYQSRDGIAKVFHAWENQDSIHREAFFCSYLNKALNVMEEELGYTLTNQLIIASGMITSSIGLKELPYTEGPIKISEPELNTAMLDPTSYFPFRLFLISGICTDKDVIRGEETQVIGALGGQKRLEKAPIIIIPGTHSKHIFIENKNIINFKTYMTGEILDLLIHSSSLRSSVIQNRYVESESLISGFYNGLQDADNGNLLNNMFQSRANFLLHRTSKEKNFAYLSGLLLGHELSDIAQHNNQIIIVGSPDLNDVYALAIQYLLNKDPEKFDIAQCNIEGQIQIGRIQGVL